MVTKLRGLIHKFREQYQDLAHTAGIAVVPNFDRLLTIPDMIYFVGSILNADVREDESLHKLFRAANRATNHRSDRGLQVVRRVALTLAFELPLVEAYLKSGMPTPKEKKPSAAKGPTYLQFKKTGRAHLPRGEFEDALRWLKEDFGISEEKAEYQLYNGVRFNAKLARIGNVFIAQANNMNDNDFPKEFAARLLKCFTLTTAKQMIEFVVIQPYHLPADSWKAALLATNPLIPLRPIATAAEDNDDLQDYHDPYVPIVLPLTKPPTGKYCILKHWVSRTFTSQVAACNGFREDTDRVEKQLWLNLAGCRFFSATQALHTKTLSHAFGFHHHLREVPSASQLSRYTLFSVDGQTWPDEAYCIPPTDKDLRNRVDTYKGEF